MKPGSNRRPRSRPNNNNNNAKRQGGRNSYDSNGPDGKVRGTAQQVLEKYQALARDATSAGDRIAAEAYFQYAEHYYRLVNVEGTQNPQRTDRQSEPQTEQQNESVGNAAPERSAPEPVETVSDVNETSEVVTVPIMPGPIEAPGVADGPDTASAAQGELLGGGNAEKQEQDVASEAKPKPVRRRRPRVKADVQGEPSAEPAQA